MVSETQNQRTHPSLTHSLTHTLSDFFTQSHHKKTHQPSLTKSNLFISSQDQIHFSSSNLNQSIPSSQPWQTMSRHPFNSQVQPSSDLNHHISIINFSLSIAWYHSQGRKPCFGSYYTITHCFRRTLEDRFLSTFLWIWSLSSHGTRGSSKVSKIRSDLIPCFFFLSFRYDWSPLPVLTNLLHQVVWSPSLYHKYRVMISLQLMASVGFQSILKKKHISLDELQYSYEPPLSCFLLLLFSEGAIRKDSFEIE